MFVMTPTKDDERMTFGERLKALRKKAGLTQEELAEAVDVHINSVSRWENNELTPKTLKIKALAKALNVTELDLLNDQPPDSGEWVITLKVSNKLEKEEINLIGNVQPVTSIQATPDGCSLTIQAGWGRLETKKDLEQLFNRILDETYPAIRSNGVALGGIKKREVVRKGRSRK